MISRCFRNFKIYRIQRWGVGEEGGGITTKLTEAGVLVRKLSQLAGCVHRPIMDFESTIVG
jgi:hypothetical protein